jgi:CRP-like cAMP-binding protein
VSNAEVLSTSSGATNGELRVLSRDGRHASPALRVKLFMGSKHLDGVTAERWARQNGLLGRLSPEAFHHLLPALTPVTLEAEEVLYKPDQQISDIYFPDTAVLCMLTIMEDARSIEAATVGNEGASWVSASVGTPTMPCQTMVAVSGRAFKIPAKRVEEELRRNGLFHNLVSEYAHALLISSLRTGACNALHSHTQRAARWMLTTLDRTSNERFRITQDFMASLLGCTRTTLNGILFEFEKSGAVQNRRGSIEILDRSLLQNFACECYETIRHTYMDLARRADKLLESR